MMEAAGYSLIGIGAAAAAASLVTWLALRSAHRLPRNVWLIPAAKGAHVIGNF